MNPFLVKGYQSPTYFCDREDETQTLIEAALNGRDITLYALRRMGKTGLLYNAAYYLKKKHKFLFLFSDVLSTDNADQLLEELTNNVIQQAFPKRSWFTKAGEAIRGIAPQISIDPFSGAPQVSISSKNQQEVFTTLEQIFALVESLNKPVYWAFDEFQQIQNYPEATPVLNKLRSLVQRSKNIHFVFSGSHKGMLMSIFEDHKAPFFKSTQLLHLKAIPEIKYTNFISKKFAKAPVKISDQAIAHLLHRCMLHTWYVQMLCNRLYQSNQDITPKQVDQVLNKILDEYEMTYYNYRSLLTKNQWMLLKAIGLETRVTQITSTAFISKYKLVGSASVLKALKRLIKDEMVVELLDEDSSYYRLNDVFLTRWLQRNYSN